MQHIKILFLLSTLFVITVSPCAAQKSGKPKKQSPDKNSATKTSVSENKNSLLSTMELAVIDEINQARQDPQKFAGYLEEYKKLMKGNVLYLPNQTGTILNEGMAVLNDAINDLKKLPKTDQLSVSDGIFRAARLQLADLKENSALSHKGKDGSDTEIRLFRFGIPGNIFAENISYKTPTAREVVMNMILDDGLKNRPHRKNVFSPKFKKIGVACGISNQKDAICVVVFADSFVDKK